MAPATPSPPGRTTTKVPSVRKYILAIVGASAALILLLIAAANRGMFRLNSDSSFALRSNYVGPSPHTKPLAVVFVHGIFGSNNDTWIDQGNSFPSMLATDPEFQGTVDVFVFEYFTPKFGSAASIVGLADQLRGSLDDHRVFDDHQRVVFLSHSMGGLIVREFLLTKRERVDKVPMLYFYATPTNGSELTVVAKEASNNPQLRGMLPIEGNDLLQAIQSGWLGWDSAKQIASYCAYELLPTYGVMVVSMSSATALCNRDLDPITANHIEIVKPADRDDPRYTRFTSALRNSLGAGLPLGKRLSGANPATLGVNIPSREIKPVFAKITDYQPGKSLSVLLADQRSLVVAVAELDDTKADVLVRFTDESGNNRDEATDAAIHRVMGASFDSGLRSGMANLGGKVRPGTAFGMSTESDVPGQTICNTFGPTYEPDPTLASERLGNAYDECFGLGSMGSALSLAFPAYEGSATGFPTEVAAPVVADRLVEGLSHETRVKKVTIAVSAAGFVAYSEALLKRLRLPAKISR